MSTDTGIFQAWPKIARLNRDITITEKIDGTNSAVVIAPIGSVDPDEENLILAQVDEYAIFAQSRTRTLTLESDNFRFAEWVVNNADKLCTTLGQGRHFGEWWGAGIQRGYGLRNNVRKFSLFNTKRFGDLSVDAYGIMGIDSVPVLYSGPFLQSAINDCLDSLRVNGSVAAPGFMRPEGIVVYHTAANVSFKVTLENDEKPKGKESN